MAAQFSDCSEKRSSLLAPSTVLAASPVALFHELRDHSAELRGVFHAFNDKLADTFLRA
jgi:hypothetical protein